jgi:hypothetical protein
VVRIGLIVVVLTLVAALPAGAVAATPVSGGFTAKSPLKKPCETALFCGAGTLSPYGAASFTYFDSSFFPHEDDLACADVTGVITSVVASTGDVLVLDTVSVVCFRWNERGLGGQGKSFGNPFDETGTWTVDGAESTGAFAGAGGSGTYTTTGAGSIARMNLQGSLTAAG